MILGAEIGLFIMAIIALATGKLQLTKNRIVYGTLARLLALFGLLPLSLALVIFFTLGFVLAQQPQAMSRQSISAIVIGIEITILILCVVAIYAIGWTFARPPAP